MISQLEYSILEKMAKSFFKYGLTFIATILLNAGFQLNIDVFKFSPVLSKSM